MTRLAALALLLLAGCAGETESSPEDIAADYGAAAGYDAVADSGIEDRLAELERRIDDLESSDDVQAQNITTLFSNGEAAQDFVNETEDRVAVIEVRLGM